MTATVTIGTRRIGGHEPCFVIAEAGVNHNGDLATAIKLIDVAARAGADAVKFQTFSADRVASASAPKAAYQKVTTAAEESQHAMLKRLELPPQAYGTLMNHCNERAIMFLSSPFDEQAADLLDSLGVAALKVPSGEIVNLAYLQHVAHKRRPLIVSTGMSTLEEVRTAVDTIRAAGNDQIVLLHCLSDYPADPAEANLRAMAAMADACNCPVGFSDHTKGQAVAIAAVALGAAAIERHFTLDRNLPGPDHRASLEPAELTAMVRDIRLTEAALGHGRKVPQPSELENRAIVRKSIAAARDLAAGAVLQAADVVMLRPGTGLAPAVLPQLLGRTVRVAVASGTLMSWEMLE
jgi:N-acetylneuraminate synthase/N,N'-diacetyllegionaminate synthase